MKKHSEYKKFDHMMRDLLKVPHSEIKAKLDEEKAKKKQRKSKHLKKQRNEP